MCAGQTSATHRTTGQGFEDVQTIRGNLIYTAFATSMFIGIQWLDGVRGIELFAISGVMFFVFTFFMLRLVQRVLGIVMKNRPPSSRTGNARHRRDAEPGPAVIEPTTERPEHVRRRRERRRRR
jgi:hypothetical protein